jgi:hypothetical protein
LKKGIVLDYNEGVGADASDFPRLEAAPTLFLEIVGAASSRDKKLSFNPD